MSTDDLSRRRPRVACPADPAKPRRLVSARVLHPHRRRPRACSSAVRVFTGADDLTSAGAVGAALAAAVPIGLAGLGGLWSERAGVINIGLEGMMILGTWGGAWGALDFGVWAGILIGALSGALGGLLHALATVTFNVDHIVSGVAITILSLGLARYLASFTFANMAGRRCHPVAERAGRCRRCRCPGSAHSKVWSGTSGS